MGDSSEKAVFMGRGECHTHGPAHGGYNSTIVQLHTSKSVAGV